MKKNEISISLFGDFRTIEFSGETTSKIEKIFNDLKLIPHSFQEYNPMTGEKKFQPMFFNEKQEFNLSIGNDRITFLLRDNEELLKDLNKFYKNLSQLFKDFNLKVVRLSHVTFFKFENNGENIIDKVDIRILGGFEDCDGWSIQKSTILNKKLCENEKQINKISTIGTFQRVNIKNEPEKSIGLLLDFNTVLNISSIDEFNGEAFLDFVKCADDELEKTIKNIQKIKL